MDTSLFDGASKFPNDKSFDVLDDPQRMHFQTNDQHSQSINEFMKKR